MKHDFKLDPQEEDSREGKMENALQHFQDLNKIIRKGERVNVLFDMLMETLEAPEDATKSDFFGLMKDAIEAHQKALASILPKYMGEAGGVKTRAKRGPKPG